MAESRRTPTTLRTLARRHQRTVRTDRLAACVLLAVTLAVAGGCGSERRGTVISAGVQRAQLPTADPQRLGIAAPAADKPSARSSATLQAGAAPTASAAYGLPQPDHTEDALPAASVDPDVVPYLRADGVSGNLSSVGSDTLANLMTLWTEEFKIIYPQVNIQVQAAGSSTAPPALAEGTANFGPMSRRMKDQELEAFEDRHGYKPTAIRVAIDALAVYVHKDNPLQFLTIPQIDAMFSVTRRCGQAQSVNNWGDAGLTGSWHNRRLQLYGRNSVSGTYGYFKNVALCSGDFKDTVNEQPGSASVVQAVASSLNGIGYSGIGYQTSGVKALPVAETPAARPVLATPANAINGDYPLSRFLYVYIDKRPGTSLSRIEEEFLRLVLSREGQQTVLKDGYIPLPARLIARELRKI